MQLYVVTYYSGCGDHASSIIEANSEEDALALAALAIPEVEQGATDVWVRKLEPEASNEKGRVIITENFCHDDGTCGDPVLPKADWNSGNLIPNLPNFVFGKTLGEVGVEEIRARSLEEAQAEMERRIGPGWRRTYSLMTIEHN